MKKVLIITYYWPPAGGPGVQRWLKFVTYLPELGIEPIVYVPENPHYPIIDKKLISEVPQNVTVVKQPISEPYQIAKIFSRKKTEQLSSGIIPKKKMSKMSRLLLYVRGNYFIPDARVGWVSPSVNFLQNFIRKNSIDTVITSGPPHSLHLIGLQLKNILNVHWIADFRDPWTTVHYHASLKLGKAAQEKHKKLEKEVLTRADRIIVTSPSTKKEFDGITKKPIEVITNGFDNYPTNSVTLDTEFSISHIGSLLSERNPKVLWEILQQLCKEDKGFQKHLKLKFAGVVSDEVKQSLKDYSLLDKAEFSGYVDHHTAVRMQRQGQILLLVEINREETKAIIPGKLFEYLAAKRPIIALGPEGSDIKAIIDEAGAGAFFNYKEGQGLKLQIQKYFKQYQEKKLNITSTGIEKFQRRELTKKLADILSK